MAHQRTYASGRQLYQDGHDLFFIENVDREQVLPATATVAQLIRLGVVLLRRDVVPGASSVPVERVGDLLDASLRERRGLSVISLGDTECLVMAGWVPGPGGYLEAPSHVRPGPDGRAVGGRARPESAIHVSALRNAGYDLSQAGLADWSRRLWRTFLAADVVGVPLFRPVGVQRILLDALRRLGRDPASLLLTDATAGQMLLQSGRLGDILRHRRARVLLVGNASTSARPGLEAAGVRVAGCVAPIRGRRNVDQVLRRIRSVSFDVALVSAGAASPELCVAVASSGGVALDFGKGMDEIALGITGLDGSSPWLSQAGGGTYALDDFQHRVSMEVQIGYQNALADIFPADLPIPLDHGMDEFLAAGARAVLVTSGNAPVLLPPGQVLAELLQAVRERRGWAYAGVEPPDAPGGDGTRPAPELRDVDVVGVPLSPAPRRPRADLAALVRGLPDARFTDALFPHLVQAERPYDAGLQRLVRGESEGPVPIAVIHRGLPAFPELVRRYGGQVAATLEATGPPHLAPPPDDTIGLVLVASGSDTAAWCAWVARHWHRPALDVRRLAAALSGGSIFHAVWSGGRIRPR